MHHTRYALLVFLASSLTVLMSAAVVSGARPALRSSHLTTNPAASASGILLSEYITASTNTAAETFVIYADGSASDSSDTSGLLRRPIRMPNRAVKAGFLALAPLRADLSEVGNASSIPVTRCGKPVSFATETYLTYGGHTSGDVSCPLASSDPKYARLIVEVRSLKAQVDAS